mgnify:CR=1 FL=1
MGAALGSSVKLLAAFLIYISRITLALYHDVNKRLHQCHTWALNPPMHQHFHIQLVSIGYKDGWTEITSKGQLTPDALHVAVRPHSRDIAENPKIVSEMDKIISGPAVGMGGSFSAEHGIAIEKVKTLYKLKNPVSYSVMKTIKQCLGPKMIMNPGKVLAPVSLINAIGARTRT